jgi:hypothetical protein
LTFLSLPSQTLLSMHIKDERFCSSSDHMAHPHSFHSCSISLNQLRWKETAPKKQTFNTSLNKACLSTKI